MQILPCGKLCGKVCGKPVEKWAWPVDNSCGKLYPQQFSTGNGEFSTVFPQVYPQGVSQFYSIFALLFHRFCLPLQLLQQIYILVVVVEIL